MKKALAILVGLLGFPLLALATPVSLDYTQPILQPLRAMMGAHFKVDHITATSTATSSQFLAGIRANASSTVGGGAGASGLTVHGGATTTGAHAFGSTIYPITTNSIAAGLTSNIFSKVWTQRVGNDSGQLFFDDGNSAARMTSGTWEFGTRSLTQVVDVTASGKASSTNASTSVLTVHGTIWSPKADGCATWSSNLLTTTGTACGAGGGGGSGTVGTSTTPNVGDIAYWTGASTLGTVATGTLSESIEGLALSASRYLIGGAAALSLDSGYTIPSTTRMTNLDSFYTTPSTRITAGTGIDWSGNTLNGVYTAGDGITLNTEDFDCDTASASVFGCLASADWTIFNNKVSSSSIDTVGELETLTGVNLIVSTEIDTIGEIETLAAGVNILLETEIDASSELLALMDDETGTGNLVFSAGPTFTGTVNGANKIFTNGTTTNATSTNIYTTNLSFPDDIFSFSIPTTSAKYATGTVGYLPPRPYDFTVTDIDCYVVSGGTSKRIIMFGETLVCGTSLTSDDGSIAIANVSAGSTTLSYTSSTTVGIPTEVFINVYGRKKHK